MRLFHILDLGKQGLRYLLSFRITYDGSFFVFLASSFSLLHWRKIFSISEVEEELNDATRVTLKDLNH